MTLDELCREYPPGTMVRTESSGRWWTVQGVVWSLPAAPGGPDQCALVATDQYGSVGAILPLEVEQRI